jgi:hypothetical protein
VTQHPGVTEWQGLMEQCMCGETESCPTPASGHQETVRQQTGRLKENETVACNLFVLLHLFVTDRPQLRIAFLRACFDMAQHKSPAQCSGWFLFNLFSPQALLILAFLLFQSTMATIFQNLRDGITEVDVILAGGESHFRPPCSRLNSS